MENKLIIVFKKIEDHYDVNINFCNQKIENNIKIKENSISDFQEAFNEIFKMMFKKEIQKIDIKFINDNVDNEFNQSINLFKELLN